MELKVSIICMRFYFNPCMRPHANNENLGLHYLHALLTVKRRMQIMPAQVLHYLHALFEKKRMQASIFALHMQASIEKCVGTVF